MSRKTTGYELKYYNPTARKQGKCAHSAKYFSIKKYGDLENCKKAAREWQINFQLEHYKDYKRIPKLIKEEIEKNPNLLKEYRERMEDQESDNLTTPQQINEPVNESPKKIILEKIKGSINLDLKKGTGNTTAIIGSSKAGKSYAMSYLYMKYYRMSITTLYSLSPNSFIDNMEQIIKKEQRHRRKNIEELVEKRKPIISPVYFANVIQSQKVLNQAAANKYPFANLFDDMINIGNNEQFNNLILTYRNFNISTIICMQYSNLLSKMSRANFNNILFFKLNTDEAIEVTIKSFLSGIFKSQVNNDWGRGSMKDMIQFYREMTKDFGYILYKPLEDKLEFGKL